MRFDSDGQALASFECAAVDGNHLYFAEAFGNEVFRYDMEKSEVMPLCTIHEEDGDGDRLFSCMIIYKKDIFLFPLMASAIYRIDIQTGNYTVLDLPGGSLKEQGMEAKFMDAHLYGDIIYVLPASFPGILEIQCNSNEIAVYDSWMKKIPSGFSDADRAFFRKTILKDNKIYAPMCQGNMVMIFDLQKKQCIAKEVGTRQCRFSGICCNKDDFWLSPRDNGPVVKWNERKDEWQEYSEFPKDYIRASTVGIAKCGNQVMVFPQSANMILTIDCVNGTMEEWREGYRGYNVTWYKGVGDSLLFYMDQIAEMFAIRGNGVESVRLLFPEIMQKLYKKKSSRTYIKLKNGIGEEDILTESYQDALKDYCQYISRSGVEKA